MSTKDKKNRDKKIINSFNNSINGIIQTIKNERHMKVHVAIAIIVIILSLIFDINRYELLMLMITVSLVLICEIINTAIEQTVDLITKEYNENAKFAKDAAAGAVMVSAILSLFVGYIVFFDKITKVIITGHQFIKLTGRISNITVLILALLSIVVVTLKAIIKKGTSLEGGMPSGHATISFSIVTIIAYITRDTKIVLLALLLALLVCQSRVKTGIHTFNEVIIGAFLGFGLTFVIFSILLSIGNIYI